MPSSPPAGPVAARAAGCRPRRPLPRPAHPPTSGRGSPRPSLPRPARRPCRRPRVLGPLRAVGGRSHPPRGRRGAPPFSSAAAAFGGSGGGGAARRPLRAFLARPAVPAAVFVGSGCRGMGSVAADQPPPLTLNSVVASVPPKTRGYVK